MTYSYVDVKAKRILEVSMDMPFGEYEGVGGSACVCVLTYSKNSEKGNQFLYSNYFTEQELLVTVHISRFILILLEANKKIVLCCCIVDMTKLSQNLTFCNHHQHFISKLHFSSLDVNLHTCQSRCRNKRNTNNFPNQEHSHKNSFKSLPYHNYHNCDIHDH